ncbi:innexin inx2 [Dendroctonus ponderosae]|uniref:Innexin n=1 Tax=Dendroctonus ponderosae TaxID=77166 RepID=A0AAR5PC72_DENPD|nr:innexin inx2 [Dendroctonus ponderosae]KAH1016729.1 hypothetical protein HUJ04_007905 [Dendroctonus ponderosae]KAH1026113.1 hypothetical protein HUJ05_010686 [Dendroctonus ponderosae]KAH1026114.1 hypothetical protein HUJ05_010686 [Dendroctonus ponderosae]
MQDFLRNFQNLIRNDNARTDNNVFQLYYKFSVIMFFVFSILLSSKQYFGDPIHCDVESLKKEIVDVICWSSGTFTVQETLQDTYLSSQSLGGLGNEVGKTTYSLLYYQWICLLFCIQALLFYVPRYLWKSWEGDRLGQIVKDLCGPLVSEKWTKSYKYKIRTYILSNENHNTFAYRFAFCELLNFIILIFQFVLMNWYLNGNFSHYGYEVMIEPWPYTFNKVFPKKTKCTYSRFGPSGSVQTHDALCILPLNTLNEKFFLLIWFWMIFLFAVTICALLYRITVLTSQQFRIFLLMAQARSLSRKKVKVVGKRVSHGQFFLLYNIGKMLNPIIYRELLMSIFEHLSDKDPNSLDF